jgi:hypothetical protein
MQNAYITLGSRHAVGVGIACFTMQGVGPNAQGLLETLQPAP